MLRSNDALAVLLGVSLGACNGATRGTTTAPTSDVAPATAAAEAGPSPFALGGRHAGCAGKAAGQHGAMAADAGHDCPMAAAKGAEHDCPMAAKAVCDCGSAAAEVRYPEVTVVAEAGGVRVTRAGAAFAGAPVVAVGELLAHPEAYAGKTVRIEGAVTAMCQHRRGWLAVQAGSGYLRVLTAPSFLVPEGAVGKRVRAEGVVDTVAVGPAEAEHLDAEHHLPAAASLRTVVLRATGAELL